MWRAMTASPPVRSHSRHCHTLLRPPCSNTPMFSEIKRPMPPPRPTTNLTSKHTRRERGDKCQQYGGWFEIITYVYTQHKVILVCFIWPAWLISFHQRFNKNNTFAKIFHTNEAAMLCWWLGGLNGPVGPKCQKLWRDRIPKTSSGRLLKRGLYQADQLYSWSETVWGTTKNGILA